LNGGKMSSRNPFIFVTLILFVICGSVLAQNDKFGKTDTLFAEPYRIDAKNWAVNVTLFNDEEIFALTIPLKFSAGKTQKIVVDSTIFKGGVADGFREKYARVDTATQCLTIGLLADLGISVPPIPPGKGRLATIFISSLDKSAIAQLDVDTTTTPPTNTLQMVKLPSDEVVPFFKILPAEKEKKAEKEEAKPAEPKGK